MKAVIAEDERIIAMNLASTIKKLGHTVVAQYTSAESILEGLKNIKPDIIFMDIKMDGKLDGIDAAMEINKKYKIPVVYTTAYSDDDTLRRAQKTNPEAFLTKPVQKELLEEVLQRVNKRL